jgi:hypothetical protein
MCLLTVRPVAVTKLFETGINFEWHPWNGSWRIVSARPLADTVDPRGSRDTGSERSNWLPAQTKLRFVNKEFNKMPKNENALPRRLDNLPVLQGNCATEEYRRRDVDVMHLGGCARTNTNFASLFLTSDSPVSLYGLYVVQLRTVCTFYQQIKSNA